jgi:SAM-dependent methyltransferase
MTTRPEPSTRVVTEPEHTRGLETMTSAVRYRRYVLDLLRPHLGRSVLEVGSGLGDLAAEIHDVDRLVVTDVDDDCLVALRRRFGGRPHVEVARLDLREDRLPATGIETVLAVNVLEHIEDDAGALRRLSSALVPGGRVVLFVPAYPSLYGPHDRAAGHVRRYRPDSLRRAVERAGLTVEVLHPVNFLGGIAWWFAVRVGGCSKPNPALVGVYDWTVVPIVRATERRWRPPFGQSILCVARAAETSPPPRDAGGRAG